MLWLLPTSVRRAALRVTPLRLRSQPRWPGMKAQHGAVAREIATVVEARGDDLEEPDAMLK